CIGAPKRFTGVPAVEADLPAAQIATKPFDKRLPSRKLDVWMAQAEIDDARRERFGIMVLPEGIRGQEGDLAALQRQVQRPCFRAGGKGSAPLARIDILAVEIRPPETEGFRTVARRIDRAVDRRRIRQVIRIAAAAVKRAHKAHLALIFPVDEQEAV